MLPKMGLLATKIKGMAWHLSVEYMMSTAAGDPIGNVCVCGFATDNSELTLLRFAC